jgi:hypothetical protein
MRDPCGTRSAMEIVKTTEEYQIIKKRSGRYGVRRTNRKWVNGDEKTKILIAEGLMKAPTPKPEPEPEPEEEAPEEAAAAEEAAPDEPSEG